MRLISFLRDQLPYLISGMLLIFLFGFVLDLLKTSFALILLLCGISILILFGALTFDFAKRRNYYNQLYAALNAIDQKQYIASMLGTATFVDAMILADVLHQTTKAMNDEIAGYQRSAEEYRDYVETWIHEVKVPISCIELICENNKNEETASIKNEVAKIDAYVEQALYYARSTNLEKDYSIKTTVLDAAVKETLKKRSRELIACNTQIQMEALDFVVYTDPKWLDFILGQVISNSVKYRKEKLKLEFSATEVSGGIILIISDNGIGIPKQDLGRVMEKGFTGENGRRYAKSTGIGLYLCKQLCKKMHLGFSVESEPQRGTTVKISFPKDKLVIMESEL